MEGDTFLDPNTYQQGSGTNTEVMNNSVDEPAVDVKTRRPIRLYIGNIPTYIKKDELKEMFLHYGQPIDVYVHPERNLLRTWGSVSFQTYEEALCAFEELNGKQPIGLIIEIMSNEDNDIENDVVNNEEIKNEKQRNNISLSKNVGRGPGVLQALSFEERLLVFREREEIEHNTENGCEGSSCDETNGSAMEEIKTQVNGLSGPERIGISRIYIDGSSGSDVMERNNTEDNIPNNYTFSENLYSSAASEGKCAVCEVITNYYCQDCNEWYCSKECQVQDWPQHKSQCMKYPRTKRTVDAQSPCNSTLNSEDFSKINLAKTGKGKKSDAEASKPGSSIENKHLKQTDSALSKKYNKSNVTTTNTSKSKNEKIKLERQGANRSVLDKFCNTCHIDHELGASSEMDKFKNIQTVPSISASNISLESITDNEELPYDSFVEVKMVVPISSVDYWVQLYGKEDQIFEMSRQLQNCEKLEIHEAVINSYCIARYGVLWFRAKIIEVEPNIKVHYIDYGEEEIKELSELKEIPAFATKLRSQAIKIRLTSETSDINRYLLQHSIFSVKAVKEIEDGSVIVHCKGIAKICHSKGKTYAYLPDSESEMEDLDQTNISRRSIVSYLKPGMLGRIEISERESIRDFIATLCCQEHAREHVSLFSNKFSEDCEKYPFENYKPTVRDVIAAKSPSDLWIRAFVLSEDVGQYTIVSCETGIVHTVQEVKRLPKKYHEIPMFAVVCSVTNFAEEEHSDIIHKGCVFSFSVERINFDVISAYLQYDNGDAVCSITIKEWRPPFELFEFPKTIDLKDGNYAITSFSSVKAIYVRPLTYKAIENYNAMLQNVTEYCVISPAYSKDHVLKVGETVGCKFSEDGNFYRAKILSIREKDILVSYIDFGNTEYVTLKQLKQLNKELKERDCSCMKIILKDVIDKPLNEEASSLLAELCNNERELKVEVCGSAKNIVDLYTSDGTHLNEKLNEILTSSYEPYLQHDETGRYEIFHYSKMPVEKLKLGSFLEVSLGTLVSYNVVLGTPVYNKVLRECGVSIHSQIEKYCIKCTEESYVPQVDELCLAKYLGTWHRAACVGVSSNITLILIDVGDVVEVPRTNIRRIIRDFTSVAPIALCLKVKIDQNCKIQNFKSLMKEFLSSLRIVTIYLQEKTKFGYIISIPTLNSYLGAI